MILVVDNYVPMIDVFLRKLICVFSQKTWVDDLVPEINRTRSIANKED